MNPWPTTPCERPELHEPFSDGQFNWTQEYSGCLEENGASANTRATGLADTYLMHSTYPPELKTPLILSCSSMIVLRLPAEFEQYVLEVVRLLIYYGADATMADEVGRTPLYYAVIGPYPLLVECLLCAGTRTDVVDVDK